MNEEVCPFIVAYVHHIYRVHNTSYHLIISS
jgi:hypothetical protein